MKKEDLKSTFLYESVFNDIKKNVESGAWKEGEKIPSEREFCDFYSVSRITVRRAIAIAESKGLVETVRGLGSFARAPKHEQPLSKLISFHNTLTKVGVKGSTRLLSSEHSVADVLVDNILHISPGEPVVKLVLVGEGDGVPIVKYESYFPYSIGKEISRRAKEWQSKGKAFSTLDLYGENREEIPTKIKQTFEAVSADKDISSCLNVKEGHPIFKVTSIVYLGDMPSEYRIAYYLGEKYKFSTERLISNS